MAMACLRLFTRPPLPPFPLRSVPCFRLCIALDTSRCELRLYFRRLFRRAILNPPLSNESARALEVAIGMPQEECGVSPDNRDDALLVQRCESQQPGKNGGLIWSFAFPALFHAGRPRARGASRFAFLLGAQARRSLPASIAEKAACISRRVGGRKVSPLSGNPDGAPHWATSQDGRWVAEDRDSASKARDAQRQMLKHGR
jgi:hypothetical protein